MPLNQKLFLAISKPSKLEGVSRIRKKEDHIEQYDLAISSLLH